MKLKRCRDLMSQFGVGSAAVPSSRLSRSPNVPVPDLADALLMRLIM
jgi:hypothetical protein